MDRGELEALQLERLKVLLRRVYENVPAYRTKFDDALFDPESVESLD